MKVSPKRTTTTKTTARLRLLACASSLWFIPNVDSFLAPPYSTIQWPCFTTRSRRLLLLQAAQEVTHPVFEFDPEGNSSGISSSDTNNSNCLLLLNADKSPIGTWNSQQWDNCMRAIHIYAYSSNEECNYTMAWTLLDRAVQEELSNSSTENQSRRYRSTATFNLILEQLISSWREQQQQQQQQNKSKMSAQEMLQKINTYQSTGLFSPTIQMYNTILDTAIKNRDQNAIQIAQEIIQSCIIHSDDDNNNTQQLIKPTPNTLTFNLAMDALAKSGIQEAPQRAEALLLTMKQGLQTQPNMRTYNTIISIWANSRQLGAAERAEVLLNESTEPNIVSYNAVINAWAKTHDTPRATQRCYQLFQHVKTLEHVNLNAISYGTMIAAFAKTGQARDAEAILKELIQQYDTTQDPDLLPDRFHFTALIDAWAKSGEQGAAQKANALLEKMQTMAKESNNMNVMPNVISFTSVLHAWAKSNHPSAFTNVEAILKQMYQLDQEGVANVKPNVHTYTTVLDCLANSKLKDTAKRAEAILQLMMVKYNAGDDSVKPNIITFNTAINALAKSRERDSCHIAEAMFTNMTALGVTPDEKTFSALISTWTNSRDPRAAMKAESYLSEMKSLYESGNLQCKPNTMTMNAVIHAWSTSKDPQAPARARYHLDQMKTTLDNSTCRPDVVTYNTVLNVIARGYATDKAVQAWQLVSDMDDASIQPNKNTLDAVLMACAFSNRFDLVSRERALELAIQVMHRAKAETTPSTHTYSFFFQAAAGLGDGLDKNVQQVYQWCCEAGFENDAIIQRDLKLALPHLVRR